MEMSKIINGKKFMWDGAEYPDIKAAGETAQKYKNDGFEAEIIEEIIEEEKKFYVFTRRVVKEVVVEGQPTI